MKSFDVVGYAMPDGYVLCLNCASEKDMNIGQPIFVDSEWDYYPSCDNCLDIIDEVNLIEY